MSNKQPKDPTSSYATGALGIALLLSVLPVGVFVGIFELVKLFQ